MRSLTLAVLCLFAFAGLNAQQKAPARKTPPSRYPVAAARKAPIASTPNRTATTAPKTNSTASRNTAASSRYTYRKPVVQSWRTRQAQPTPERYQEIQSALVAKGYLSAENANGAWNQASVDALKRFQAEQNIDSSGKINSLSLIALGLGPKHESALPVAAPQQQ